MRCGCRPPWLVALLCVTLGTLSPGCSTLRQMQEKQQPFVSAQVTAEADDVYAAVLSVLPDFDLIVTARYDDQRFVEARGDWESPQEGAVVHVSVQALGPISSVKIDAGPSDFDSSESKRKLSQAIMTRITELLQRDNRAP